VLAKQDSGLVVDLYLSSRLNIAFFERREDLVIDTDFSPQLGKKMFSFLSIVHYAATI
jgi:hypothetical protein